MRFLSYGTAHSREDAITLDLEPRLACVMRDAAWWNWQHSVAPTKEHRYSIAFRTALRRVCGAASGLRPLVTGDR